MKLKTDGHMKYSARESRVFSLLRTQEQSTLILCQQFYQPKRPPFHGRQIILGLLSSLARKAIANRESFRVRKSSRAGPYPISFWVEQ